MKTLVRGALIAALLGGAACRQPDGRTPIPTADQQNEIGDIARDLLNLVNNDREAPGDLASDLQKYTEEDAGLDQSKELTRRLIEGLEGARLDEPTAEQLARTLWVGLTARDYSNRQVDALKTELTAVLTKAGVPANRAQPIAEQLGAVQQAITTNPKRWYQVF